MNYYTLFFRIYCREQYKRLWNASRAAVLAIFGKRDPEGWNQFTVYDHGIFWRLLRDCWLLLGTVIRIVFGTFVVASVLLLLPTLAILRVVLIPFIGAIRGIRISAKTKEEMNARSQ